MARGTPTRRKAMHGELRKGRNGTIHTHPQTPLLRGRRTINVYYLRQRRAAPSLGSSVEGSTSYERGGASWKGPWCSLSPLSSQVLLLDLLLQSIPQVVQRRSSSRTGTERTPRPFPCRPPSFARWAAPVPTRCPGQRRVLL